MTIPIINNTSQSEDKKKYLGFITTVINAKDIVAILEDKTGGTRTGKLRIVGASTPNNRIKQWEEEGAPPNNFHGTNFVYLFEADRIDGDTGLPNSNITFPDIDIVNDAFKTNVSASKSGSKADTRNYKGEKITAG
jgi:hypothetical protein